MKNAPDQMSERDAAERRDNALRRALTTPYKPQDDLKKSGEKSVKPTTSKGRVRAGKGRS